MEEFLSDIERMIYSQLGELLNSANIVIAGLSIVAASFFGVWLLYKSYLIMAGFSQEPVMDLLKEFVIKSLIFFFVTTAPYYYKSFAEELIIKPTIGLGAELAGNKNYDIDYDDQVLVFGNIGKLLDNVSDGMTVALSPNAKQKPSGAWESIKSFFSGIVDALDINGWLTTIGIIIKLMLISAGALYMAIVSFMTILTSRVFAFISIGIGPIFIFFAAFQSTRNWFFSWLASTLGYLFTFIAVMLAWGFMLKVTESLFFDPSKTDILTWPSAFKSFMACFFMAAVVSRIGDLASTWFSSSNITDGTNAVLAASGYKAAGNGMKGAKISAQAGGRGAKGTYRLGRSAYNAYKKTKLKDGS